MFDSCKMVEKQSEAFHTFLWHIFPSLKHNFIAYRSSKVPSRSDCIFEIHQLWQSGFSRVYSICCCSCWFEPEIIKNGQSYHKMYSNNILNFQESTLFLNACTNLSAAMRPRNQRNWIQVAPFRSLSVLYRWESFWLPYPLRYVLNSITAVLLTGWLWP